MVSSSASQSHCSFGCLCGLDASDASQDFIDDPVIAPTQAMKSRNGGRDGIVDANVFASCCVIADAFGPKLFKANARIHAGRFAEGSTVGSTVIALRKLWTDEQGAMRFYRAH